MLCSQLVMVQKVAGSMNYRVSIGRRFGPVAVAVGLVLGGCTPVGADSSAVDGDQRTETETLTTPEPVETESIGMPEIVMPSFTPTPGPLGEFLIGIGLGWNPNESMDEVLAREIQNKWLEQELLAQCLAEHGFAYEPTLANWSIVYGTEFSVPHASRNFAFQYGYGISTSPEFTELRTESDIENPNVAIWSEMSAAEAAEFALAWDDCLDEIWVKMWSAPSGFEELEREILNFDIAMSNDPRMVALNQEWANCMEQYVPGPHHNPLATQHAIWDEWNSSPIQPNQEAFAVFEIETATADWDCRYEIEYEARQEVIFHDLQQQFLDRHRSELEAWGLYAAELRGLGN